MPRYVDGFLVAVPTKNLGAYQKLARKAGKIWKEHGALDFKECVGDDLEIPGMGSFPSRIRLKPDETIIFSFIVYKSKADRNRINKRVMADPRLMKDEQMPFDIKRMTYGGFKTIVDLG